MTDWERIGKTVAVCPLCGGQMDLSDVVCWRCDEATDGLAPGAYVEGPWHDPGWLVSGEYFDAGEGHFRTREVVLRVSDILKLRRRRDVRLEWKSLLERVHELEEVAELRGGLLEEAGEHVNAAFDVYYRMREIVDELGEERERRGEKGGAVGVGEETNSPAALLLKELRQLREVLVSLSLSMRMEEE